MSETRRGFIGSIFGAMFAFIVGSRKAPAGITRDGLENGVICYDSKTNRISTSPETKYVNVYVTDGQEITEQIALQSHGVELKFVNLTATGNVTCKGPIPCGLNAITLGNCGIQLIDVEGKPRTLCSKWGGYNRLHVDSGQLKSGQFKADTVTIELDPINLSDLTSAGHTPFYAGANSTGNTNWVFKAK